ncbi:MAG TPA: PDZ domain-containing protein [Gemmatimonadaceae bacterium]|nr:PDZ domain-containing protein [Gemmatimonadaceae bacterium]
MMQVLAMSRVIPGGAVARRCVLTMFVSAAALLVVAAHVDAQVASTSVRQRSASTPRDSARTRRERLLLRFDSLRYEFEHTRLSDADRESLSDEMHDTMMALQESLDGNEPAMAMAFKRADPTRGYLGLSFDGPNVDERRGGERIIRFLDYPRIALVEPGSPAERAGIAEGDTLLQLNGSDVRDRPISLTKILVPDQRIRLRVRRATTPMEFRVTVAKAPGYVMSRMAPPAPMVVGVAPTPAAPRSVRVYPGEDLPRTPMPPMAPMPAAMAMTWVMQDGVAGARLENITEGLGRALGTSSGVLVLRVAPGSPAAESGLRDGDIILRASGTPVRSVREVREQLLDADGDAGVKLLLLRERKQREITLRW